MTKKKKKPHEKMFNIISHQGNTNQNPQEVSLHTTALIKKTVTVAGKGVEKSEASHFILLVMEGESVFVNGSHSFVY